MLDDDGRYEVLRSRDARFDGEFFVAVRTTGVFCRPSCPAMTPKRINVRFFVTSAAAQEAGFRACRRCRPDAVPGSAAWNVRADSVARAMRLIGDGVVDRDGVPGLARRLGYSTRQLQRQLVAEVGAGPKALARAQRAHMARVLLQTTGMSAGEVAFAAGFTSVRQFNDTIREIYGCTPTELRRRVPGRKSRFGPVARPGIPWRVPAADAEGGAPGGVSLRLAFRPPYARTAIFDFLQDRLIGGVEEMVGDRGDREYRRTLRLPQGTGIAEVRERSDGDWLETRLHLAELRDLTTAVGRIRRLFDLDADPCAVRERLGADPVLGDRVLSRPGLRAPGTVDPHELAMRAVLGEDPALGEALVRVCGEPMAAPSGGLTHLFPAVESIADTDLPGPAGRVLRDLSAALAMGKVVVDAGVDRDEAAHALLGIPGVGPAEAGYIRMRALGDPDVLLPGLPGPSARQRKPMVHGSGANSWHPWRTYATHYLSAIS
jgi:AraC family transcriptional regulator of adaptative response / DNA-3-methyladenine glycosylase II